MNDSYVGSRHVFVKPWESVIQHRFLARKALSFNSLIKASWNCGIQCEFTPFSRYLLDVLQCPLNRKIHDGRGTSIREIWSGFPMQ
jgi:hypothetical protein